MNTLLPVFGFQLNFLIQLQVDVFPTAGENCSKKTLSYIKCRGNLDQMYK